MRSRTSCWTLELEWKVLKVQESEGEDWSGWGEGSGTWDEEERDSTRSFVQQFEVGSVNAFPPTLLLYFCLQLDWIVASVSASLIPCGAAPGGTNLSCSLTAPHRVGSFESSQLPPPPRRSTRTHERCSAPL